MEWKVTKLSHLSLIKPEFDPIILKVIMIFYKFSLSQLYCVVLQGGVFVYILSFSTVIRYLHALNSIPDNYLCGRKYTHTLTTKSGIIKNNSFALTAASVSDNGRQFFFLTYHQFATNKCFLGSLLLRFRWKYVIRTIIIYVYFDSLNKKFSRKLYFF